MKIALVVATMNPDRAKAAIKDWQDRSNPLSGEIIIDNSKDNLGVVGAYEAGYRAGADFDILAYIHDDVAIYEQCWNQRVLAEFFNDPSVGLVGFGGAKRHGSPDLYKTPYRLNQLARYDYYSNTRDAEVHGTRSNGVVNVAVLDGFSLIVRRELLDRCGGWEPDKWPSHHCYDYAICAQARRYGYKIKMIGIDCQHFGGMTATSATYQAWAASTKWKSDVDMHIEGHKLFYEKFRDVLPVEVK